MDDLHLRLVWSALPRALPERLFVLVLRPTDASPPAALAGNPTCERKQRVSKVVFTLIIDIDEDGVPMRRYTGPVDGLPEEARHTFEFIRQRYKFAQSYALAKAEKRQKEQSNPQVEAVYREEHHEHVH